MRSGSDNLSTRIAADNAYLQAFLTLRKHCNSIWRTAHGTSLTDIRDVFFPPVLRPPDVSDGDAETGTTDDRAKKA